jgi:hypothetical protein
MLSKNDILNLKTEIETKANPNSEIYGKLLEWQEGFSNHYAIGLSNKYMSIKRLRKEIYLYNN